ncbi:MAG: Fic family protein [Candidatus Thermoplasmatota archaeon]
MVALRERKRGGRSYFYLEHSARVGGRVVKREKYLGRSIPDDLEKVKRAFAEEIYRERWLAELDVIKAGYDMHKKRLPTSAAEKELASFAVVFTYNTNRIEGSKLTLRETAHLLERSITPSAKPLRDIKEAEAHRDAFMEMVAEKKDIAYQTLLYYHKRLFESTKRDIAGQLRQHQVAISGSRFVPPLAVEVHPLLMEFLSWYRKSKGNLHPVELAALVHLKLVTIHPFADGNGRISRLMVNLVLNRNGFPMLDIPYEKRVGYYSALERAQVKNDEAIFLNWFFRRYLKENGKYARKEER